MMTAITCVLEAATTALFVPGDRPERFLKARDSKADLVIIDLEDSVSEESKSGALKNVVIALQEGTDESGLSAIVRVNADRLAVELPALLELSRVPGNGLLGVMVPKVESPDDVPELNGELQVIALVETALGIENALEIARNPNVVRLAFGGVDFAAQLGSKHKALHEYVKSRLLIASAAAQIAAPLDSPATEIRDLQIVADEAIESYGLGFGGKLCIHPAQVEVVALAFRPSESEIQWARKVIESGNQTGIVVGQMVDKPVYEQAVRILKRAGN